MSTTQLLEEHGLSLRKDYATASVSLMDKDGNVRAVLSARELSENMTPDSVETLIKKKLGIK